MIRAAVVGLGKMGLLHASLLNVIPDVKVVAVCEKSRLISRFAGKALAGITLVSDVTQLSGLHPDVVYVTTPTSTHHTIAKMVLTQGISGNIFVEKPLASNYVQSEELCNLRSSSSTVQTTLVGYNRRFNVTFRRAREILLEGVIGDTLSFEAYAFSSDFVANQSTKKGTGRGGVLRDLACHAIDLTTWFFGGLSVQSVNSSKLSQAGLLDSASFAVSTPTGISGGIRASWCETNYRLPEIGLEIRGTKGQTLIVNDDKIELRNENRVLKSWHKQDLDDNVHFMLGGTDYFREDEEYMTAIKTGKAIEPGFLTASRVDVVVSAMERLVAEQGHDR
jgi:predicted dehydrogenase